MLPESAVDSCHWFGEGFSGGEGSWAGHYLFLVVNKMKIVLFNFPLVLYQHLLERMPIRDTVALGFPEHCFQCVDY